MWANPKASWPPRHCCMFDTAGPRLFALPCGADFPAHLVLGLQERLAGQPPQAMARGQLYVNTARMRRRVTDLLTASGAALLPRIHLITDLAKDAALPPAVPPLRRRPGTGHGGAGGGGGAKKGRPTPPADRVIVAGSTGSRGTTALLMQLGAGLPQGALVLPGFDTDLPAPVWDALAEPMTSEDHPQYRFRHLLDLMQLSPT